MQVLVVIAAGNAFVAGAMFGMCVYEHRGLLARRNAARKLLGGVSVLEAHSILLSCEGLSARIITMVVRMAYETSLPTRVLPFEAYSKKRIENLILKAGLYGVITPQVVAWARVRMACIAAVVAGVVGSFFSSVLAVLGCVFGLVWGFGAVPRALQSEAQARSFVAEKELSQMIEVVVLGLRSGMSFDKALVLYTQQFSGSLAAALASAYSQWSHGLISRSEGLRQVARSYDSVLFDRLAENIIRSLRFGTSLAENLSVLAVEARAVRKAKLEERVAKAPIKMLLPVGALILPAMLILILGPIMLELMAGF